jgi:hypothetical protein
MRWLALLAIVTLASCGSSEDIAGQRFEPATPGRLTVATSVPALDSEGHAPGGTDRRDGGGRGRP